MKGPQAEIRRSRTGGMARANTRKSRLSSENRLPPFGPKSTVHLRRCALDGGGKAAHNKNNGYFLYFWFLFRHAMTQLRSHAVKPRAAAHVDTFAEAA